MDSYEKMYRDLLKQDAAKGSKSAKFLLMEDEAAAKVAEFGGVWDEDEV